jgi:hypothetical protein
MKRERREAALRRAAAAAPPPPPPALVVYISRAKQIELPGNKRRRYIRGGRCGINKSQNNKRIRKQINNDQKRECRKERNV